MTKRWRLRLVKRDAGKIASALENLHRALTKIDQVELPFPPP